MSPIAIIIVLVIIVVWYVYFTSTSSDVGSDTSDVAATAVDATPAATPVVATPEPSSTMSPGVATPSPTIVPVPLDQVQTATSTGAAPTPAAPADQPAPTVIQSVATAITSAVTAPATTAATATVVQPVNTPDESVPAVAPVVQPTAPATVASVVSTISDAITGAPTVPTLFAEVDFKGSSWKATNVGTFKMDPVVYRSIKVPVGWKVSGYLGKSLQWTKTKGDNSINVGKAKVDRVVAAKITPPTPKNKPKTKVQEAVPTPTVATNTGPVPLPATSTTPAMSPATATTTAIVPAATTTATTTTTTAATATVTPATSVTPVVVTPVATPIVAPPSTPIPPVEQPGLFDSIVNTVVGQQMPTFYKDVNFKGASWTPSGAGRYTLPASFGTVVKSVKIPAGLRVAAYSDAGCSKNMWIKTKNDNKIAGSTSVLCVIIDDTESTASSTGIVGAVTGGNLPVLYALQEFKGATWSPQAAGKHVIPASFNGVIRSVKVPSGWKVTAYVGGDCSQLAWSKTKNDNRIPTPKIGCILVEELKPPQMSKKSKTPSEIPASVGLAPTTPPAAPPAGTLPVLYGQANWKGTAYTIPGEGKYVITGKMDNNSASIRVPAGWNVKGYDNKKCSGTPLATFDSDVAAMAAAQKNKISCVIASRAAGPVARTESAGSSATAPESSNSLAAAPVTSTPAAQPAIQWPTIYADANYGGASYQLGKVGNNSLKGLPINNTASSIRIPQGYQVTAWGRGDCTGKTAVFKNDIPNLATVNFDNTMACATVAKV